MPQVLSSLYPIICVVDEACKEDELVCKCEYYVSLALVSGKVFFRLYMEINCVDQRGWSCGAGEAEASRENLAERVNSEDPAFSVEREVAWRSRLRVKV